MNLGMESSDPHKKDLNMETPPVKKESKPAVRKTVYASIRVAKETARSLQLQLAQVNKKDYGKRIKPDQLIALALGLIKPEHVTQLQETSLSNQDRFERDYSAYIAEHGKITKDEFLGKLMKGEIVRKDSV